MARSWTWRVATALALLAAIVLTGVLVLAPLNRNAPDVWQIADPASIVGALASSLVGWLIATRRPANSLGWLFLVMGLVAQLSTLALHWGIYGLETHPGRPAAAFGLWLGFALAAVNPVTLPLLLFPSGRLSGRYVQFLATATLGSQAMLALFLMSAHFVPPGFPLVFEQTPNPFSWRTEPIGDPGLMIMAIALCGLLSVAVLLTRFRRARGVARQQYQWVVLAMVLIVAAFVADFVARASGSEFYRLTSPLQSLAVALVPSAMGVAILRHHLFDIDRVFNRALVYGALTALLGTFYLSLILAAQLLLAPLTSRNDLTLVISTLTVAVLFQPARRRVQSAVDHRFYRRRYDAVRTVDSFSTTARNEVDLERLLGALVATVNDTVRPASISVWLRDR